MPNDKDKNVEMLVREYESKSVADIHESIIEQDGITRTELRYFLSEISRLSKVHMRMIEAFRQYDEKLNQDYLSALQNNSGELFLSQLIDSDRAMIISRDVIPFSELNNVAVYEMAFENQSQLGTIPLSEEESQKSKEEMLTVRRAMQQLVTTFDNPLEIEKLAHEMLELFEVYEERAVLAGFRSLDKGLIMKMIKLSLKNNMTLAQKISSAGNITIKDGYLKAKAENNVQKFLMALDTSDIEKLLELITPPQISEDDLNSLSPKARKACEEYQKQAEIEKNSICESYIKSVLNNSKLSEQEVADRVADIISLWSPSGIITYLQGGLSLDLESLQELANIAGNGNAIQKLDEISDLLTDEYLDVTNLDAEVINSIFDDLRGKNACEMAKTIVNMPIVKVIELLAEANVTYGCNDRFCITLREAIETNADAYLVRAIAEGRERLFLSYISSEKKQSMVEAFDKNHIPGIEFSNDIIALVIRDSLDAELKSRDNLSNKGNGLQMMPTGHKEGSN